MVARTVILINLKEGVSVKLLLTPALYGVAKERGLDLFTRPADGQDKELRGLEQYTKIAYCAAINAWQVAAVDDPELGEFPYNYEDFHLWSYAQPKEFGKAIDAILVALTGKSAREYVREAEGPQDEKKKRTPSLFRWITRRSKPSS